MKPLVSVIVPTYNRPDMLGECLESISRQTYSNLEVLVVNDGGQEVEEIISHFSKVGCVRYISHSTNRGLAAARNSGIRAAKGKYVAYLDDDDIYYPDHIETLVGFLEESRHLVAYTDACRVVQKKENGGYVIEKKDVPYSMDFSRDQMLISNYIPVLCIMHEISCIVKTGYFDESLTSHEDWDLWVRMSRMFEFGHIGKTTCEFRWRYDATTMTSHTREDFLRTLEIIHDRYRKFAQEDPDIIRSQKKFALKERRLLKMWKFLAVMENVFGRKFLMFRKYLTRS